MVTVRSYLHMNNYVCRYIGDALSVVILMFLETTVQLI